MTNFEIITKNVYNLAKFIEWVQDDALEAKGCSLDITMPDIFDMEEPKVLLSWDEWLKQEAEDGFCVTTKGTISYD